MIFRALGLRRIHRLSYFRMRHARNSRRLKGVHQVSLYSGIRRFAEGCRKDRARTSQAVDEQTTVIYVFKLIDVCVLSVELGRSVYWTTE